MRGRESGNGDCQSWFSTPEMWGWCNPWFIIHTTVAPGPLVVCQILSYLLGEGGFSVHQEPPRQIQMLRCLCVHTHWTLLTPTNKLNLPLSTHRAREIVANTIWHWYRDGSKCLVVVKTIFMHSVQGCLCSEWCFMPGAIPDPETMLGKASWSLGVRCTAA